MSRSDITRRLKRHGVAATPQRVEIARILLDRPQHLSAEQILERLRGKGSAVSKATVYNTMHLFAEKGLIREVNVDPSRTFFDSTTRPHHHFYNVDTGELSDIPDDHVGLKHLPLLPEGTDLDSVEVLVRVRNK